jgi:LmbE family N-acetylglucosaminyl deacetylase
VLEFCWLWPFRQLLKVVATCLPIRIAQINNRAPDSRFKADIIIVAAHPDDETLVTAYLAREIFDHHKRVAVVYGTRGDGGNNDIGPEQALVMGQIREIEARRALATLGISNVWFLTGRDTPSQNVLNSLERCGHGSNLDQLVRIVRITRPSVILTRPSVILTFLPDFTTGENQADHQAAGVLATEAFDLAGDPTTFPEHVSPVTNPDGNMNMTEGLRTWQSEKIYYFHNPTYDIFSGRGPQYSSDEISPSRHLKYDVLAAETFSQHRTQDGDRVRHAIEDGTLEHSNDGGAQLVTQPVKLILGRSLVACATSDDVFTGIQQEGIPFQLASIPVAAHLECCAGRFHSCFADELGEVQRGPEAWRLP